MCWITAGRRLGNFGSPLGCLALIPDILSLEYLAPSGATLRTTICCKRRRCLEEFPFSDRTEGNCPGTAT